MPVVVGGIEIASGGGFTQGTGDVGDGMGSVGDLAGSGNTTQLKIGYRASPNLRSSASMEVRRSTPMGIGSPSSIAEVLGATAGIYADWHFRPMAHRRSVAVGRRRLARPVGGASDDDSYQSLQGIDLLRLEAGVDFRLTPKLAMGPMVGLTTTAFVARHGSQTHGHDVVEDPGDRRLLLRGLPESLRHLRPDRKQ